MYSDENKSSSLAKLLNSFDFVIMDTCSLMEDSFPLFMDILVNAKDYLKEDARITVYHKCLDELKKHSKNRANDDLRIAAKRALKILKQAKRAKLFDFTKKEKDQNFADNVIYVSVSQLRITKKVLVITQDKGLAEDLGKLNFLDSQRGRKVATYKLLSSGILDVNRGEKGKHTSFRQREEQRVSSVPANVAKPAKKASQNDLVAKAKAHDDNLWSLLHNPNCPAKRKKTDISAQLSLLGKLTEESKKTLTLHYSQAALMEELKKIDTPIASKPVEEAKKTAQVSPKPAPAKKEEAKPVEAKPVPEIRGFFGNGHNLEEAIIDAARYQGILFRDSSVEYIPQIHGGMNLTAQELPAIVKMVQSGPKEGITYRDRLFIKPEKAIRGVRVSLALLKEQPKVVVEEPKKPAPKPEKPKEKAPEKATKKPTPKKASSSKKKSEPKKEKPIEQTGSVQGTLVVAVPDDEKIKTAIERKAKKQTPAPSPVLKAEKPAPKAKPVVKKETSKPAPKKTAKKAEIKEENVSSAKKSVTSKPAKKAQKAQKKTPEKKPEAPKKPAPEKKVPSKENALKKEEKSPAKKPAPKKKEPAKKKGQTKKAEQPAQSTAFEKAQKSEARLLSVLSNGNYPKESKLQDLKTQLELVRALKPEEVSKLKYNSDALRGMIALMS